MKKQFYFILTTMLSLNSFVFSQNERPKTNEVKKQSASSCDSYSEFKKKQKETKEKQASELSKTNKK